MRVFSFVLGSISCPSSRYRVYNYIDSFKAAGIDFKYSYFWGEFYFKHVLSSKKVFKKRLMLFFYFPLCILKRYISILRILRSDIVHIERDFCPGLPIVGEWFIKRILKKILIYEYDDAVYLSDIPRGKTNKVIEMADGVIAGNKYLEAHASMSCKNIICIPTSIDTNKYRNEKALNKFENPAIVIGWIGSFSTLKYMELVKRPLSRISKEYNVEICVVCNKKLVWNSDINITNITWTLESYIRALCRFDIGIMPLESTEWEKGKCGFKLIQYMGVGIPVVASSVGVNNEIITNSVNGFVVDSEEEWYNSLSKLINDAGLRKSMGEEGLKVVQESYSIQSNSSHLINFYKNTLNNRRL